MALSIVEISFNPVKHGLVKCAYDWPHSSFYRDMERGDLPRDWGGSVALESEPCGLRE